MENMYVLADWELRLSFSLPVTQNVASPWPEEGWDGLQTHNPPEPVVIEK